jgi:hypothetical protein
VLLLLRTTAMGATHGLKLLQLVGSKNAGELTLGIFMQGSELLAALIGREVSVGAQRRHPLLLSSQNGLKLGCLIGGEAKPLAEMLRSLLRIEVTAMATTQLVCRLLCGGIVCRLLGRRLGECHRSGESKCQG